ncbi:BQ2448_4655 [Microbotryum intermedium]|uniref:Ubiquitin-like-conjugating enzyme ATG10 n=1 Tax=Microbotryum intermedium TaxID=269621 RepID=A0A238FII7_9BASI|nr:BQ2448_4655 [Microbotryum intermedium]
MLMSFLHMRCRAPLQRKIIRPREDSNPLEVDDPHDEHVGPTLEEPQDTSSLAEQGTAPNELCTLNLHVCWSPTYLVPVLYFTAHKQNGAPLQLLELFNSTVFQHIYYAATQSSFEPVPRPLTSESADLLPPAPFISQADHPTLGIPTWFLHPCNTQAVIQEVLCGEQDSLASYFNTWLMVVGSVVDLRE